MRFRLHAITSLLPERVLSSLMWLFVQRAGIRFFTLVQLVICARLFTPHDLGLWGTLILIFQTAEIFTQLPVDQTLLVHESSSSESKKMVHTIWSFRLINGACVSLFLGALLFIFSFPPAIVVALCLGFVMRQIVHPGVHVQARNLVYQQAVIHTLIASALGFAFFLVLVVPSPTIHRLALSQLITETILVFGTFRATSSSVRFIFQFRGLFDRVLMAYRMYASTVLTFSFMHLDDYVVRFFLGPYSLGLYQMAYRISQLPMTEFSSVFVPLLTALFGRHAHEPRVLRRIFYGSLALFTGWGVLASCTLIASASWVVRTILGDPWLPIVPLVKILSVWGCLFTITSVHGPFSVGLNLPRVLLIPQIYQLFALCLIIIPATVQYGLIGASLAVVFASLLPRLYGLWMIHRLLKRADEIR